MLVGVGCIFMDMVSAEIFLCVHTLSPHDALPILPISFARRQSFCGAAARMSFEPMNTEICARPCNGPFIGLSMKFRGSEFPAYAAPAFFNQIGRPHV